MTEPSASDRIASLERRLRRANAAREEAESILERRARELVYLNDKLAAREHELLRKLDEESQHLLYAQRTAQIATFHRARGQSFFTSPEFNNLLGLPADQRPSEQVLLSVVHPLDRDRVIREEQQFYSSSLAGAERSYEYRITKAGETRWLRWVMRREDDEQGRFLSVFGSVQDITVQRRADRHARALALIADRRVKQLTRLSAELAASQNEAEQAYRAKSQFLAMMSHDIRTPLNGLLGMNDMLALGELNPAQRERLEVAHEAATQLHRQIEDIVAMARGESGTLTYVPQAVPIRRSLNSLVRFWRAGQPDVGARLQLVLSETLPEVIASDPTRLRQLLDAFIERLRGGKADIELSAKADAQHVHISVTRAATSARNPDRRSSDREVLNRVAESMGARIEVTYDAAQIRYLLVLPHTPAPAPAPPEEEEQAYSAEQEIASAATMAPLICDGRRPVVLVADDVEVNRFVLLQMLDALGCDVDTADDGREAVEMAKGRAYDAILMDIRMPNMSGTEAMQVLRAGAFRTPPNTPIVAVTAHADDVELVELKAQGFSEALGKPVRRVHIAETLQSLFAAAGGVSKAPDSSTDGDPEPLDDSASYAPQAQIDSAHFMSIFGPLPASRRRMLLDVAIADFERLGAEIAQAVDQVDAAMLEQASHSLKGVAGNFGAFALMDSIAALRNADMAEARGLLSAFHAQVDEVVDEARTLFETRDL